MAGVDSEDEGPERAWMGSNPDKPKQVWPVTIISRDATSCLIQWAQGDSAIVYERITVKPHQLKSWPDVAGVVMTPVAQRAYDALLEADPTIEDVIARKKRVRNSTGFWNGSSSEKTAGPSEKTAVPSEKKAGPSEKKVRKKPAPTNQSAAKPSPAKKPKQVKCPSRSSFRPLILLAAATQEPAIIR
jgi:hypothetical protein